LRKEEEDEDESTQPMDVTNETSNM